MEVFMQVHRLVTGGALWVSEGLRHAITKYLTPLSTHRLVATRSIRRNAGLRFSENGDCATFSARALACVLAAALLSLVLVAPTLAQVQPPPGPAVTVFEDAPSLNFSANQSAKWPQSAEPKSLAKFSGVIGMAVSPNGRQLAVAIPQPHRLVVVWGLPEGRVLFALEAPDGAEVFNSVRFSPDGCCLITSSLNGSVRLWDLKTKQLITSNYTQEALRGTTLKLSPDGKWLAVFGRTPTSVRLMHFPSLQLAALLMPAERSPQVHFTGDSKRLIITVGTAVSSYDIATAVQEPLFTVDIKDRAPLPLTSWLAGDYLYFLGAASIDKWDYSTGLRVWTKPLPKRKEYISIPGEPSPIEYFGPMDRSYIGPINSANGSPFAVNIGLSLLIINPDTGDIIQEVRTSAHDERRTTFNSAGTMLITTDNQRLTVWQ